MANATLFEKIFVNVFTPLEYLASRVCKEEDEERDLNLFQKVQDKINSYQTLLNSLENGHKKFVQYYMRSTCGRIQVRLAMRRGFLSQAEYDELHSRNLLRR